MAESSRPVRKPGIASRRLGEECLLYDDERGSIHVLNSVAELVWSLCDGEHDVGEMEAKIREAFEVPHGKEIRDDIVSILADFMRLEVLESG
ncbi:MAG: PqqD family protein [Acidobacteriota bacterium]|nr:PqqD family protein [Acidobacteriota bacterium]